MFALIQPGLLIFSLRIVDISLYMMRIMMVARGRKRMAWLFAFSQSMVFVTALRAVISDLGNWYNLLGYAAGFATGNVVGMLIEERLAIGHTHLRIVTPRHGAEIIERLRAMGYAVTEISGKGRDGTVALLICDILRKDLRVVTDIISHLDPQAFITAQNMRPIWRGYWHQPEPTKWLGVHK